jgi:hypothetical protein
MAVPVLWRLLWGSFGGVRRGAVAVVKLWDGLTRTAHAEGVNDAFGGVECALERFCVVFSRCTHQLRSDVRMEPRH